MRDQFDAGGRLQERCLDTDSTRDRSANTGGPYTTPPGAGHQLAADWDLEWSQRDRPALRLIMARPRLQNRRQPERGQEPDAQLQGAIAKRLDRRARAVALK
jgi:hypothetical protein